MVKKTADHTGSRFDDYLEAEGLLAEAEAVAIMRVLAWQVAEAMKAQSRPRMPWRER